MISTKKSYYAFIDLLKALAIFFVVFYHSFCTTIDFNFLSLADYLKYLFYTILGMGVPFFFIVNGFLLFQVKFDFKRHVLKTMRIIIITGIWGIFSLIILMIIKNDKFSPTEFLRALISLKQGYINHLWFMEALVFIYILYPFLRWIYEKNFSVFKLIFGGIICYTIVIPTCCAVSEVIYGNMEKNFFIEVLQSIPRSYFFFAIAYFMAGGTIYKFCKNKKIKKEKLILIVIVVIVMISIQTICGVLRSKHMERLFDNAWAGYDSIFIFVTVYLVFIVMCQYYKRKTLKLVKRIGSNSLGIYFIHPILIAIIMGIPEIKLACHSFIVNFIFSIFLVLISFFITIFLKKLPIINGLVRL